MQYSFTARPGYPAYYLQNEFALSISAATRNNMNIQMFRDNLKRTIANKEQYLQTLQDAVGRTVAGETSYLVAQTTSEFLKININELKRMLEDAERCVNKEYNDSWANNPDRQGGSFTADELDPNRGWK